MWYPCLTRFIKGFLEGTHFLRPSPSSAVQITLSCLVMCFPLSCRMCDDPSDWREHLKGIIPRTGFLRQQAQRRNGAAWDMLGMGHWPTWSTNPKNKKTRLQTINDKQPDRHWPKQLQYIPIISPCLPPRLTHYVGIPSYHQMNISSWFLYPQLK